MPPDQTAPATARLRHVAALMILAMILLCSSAAWIVRDRVVRDGDEEGHVGAAELVAAAWRDGGPAEALPLSLWGALGEYPPLYPGLVGGWWAATGHGDPADLPVRGLNLLWPLLTALGVWGLARPLGSRAAAVAAATALMLPLPGALARHFMPEGALVAAVVLAAWAMDSARRRPAPWRFALAGLAVGAAFLVKQTALLYLAPVMLVCMPRRPRSLLLPGVALAAILPWALPHAPEQLSYGRHTMEAAQASLLAHAWFPPWAMLMAVAGPPITLLALAALRRSRALSPEERRTWRLALVWLLGSLFLLWLLPRKYPRLLAPAAPALALMAGVGAARGLDGVQRLLLLGALLWWGLGAFGTTPLPSSALAIDDRCPQVWIRPPEPDDLGIGAVIEAARAAPPGPVLVLQAPPIPCHVQTTFDWDHHLGPALRRAGVERPVVTGEPLEAPAVVVDWAPGAPGREVPAPALGASFHLR